MSFAFFITIQALSVLAFVATFFEYRRVLHSRAQLFELLHLPMVRRTSPLVFSILYMVTTVLILGASLYVYLSLPVAA